MELDIYKYSKSPSNCLPMNLFSLFPYFLSLLFSWGIHSDFLSFPITLFIFAIQIPSMHSSHRPLAQKLLGSFPCIWSCFKMLWEGWDNQVKQGMERNLALIQSSYSTLDSRKRFPLTQIHYSYSMKLRFWTHVLQKFLIVHCRRTTSAVGPAWRSAV